MKPILITFCLVASMIFLTGCPYESTVPIDAPSVKINTALLGTWEDAKSNAIYKVTKKDEFTYRIDQMNDPKNALKLLAYESKINGVTFLNFWESPPANSSKKYSFYQMEIEVDGSIILSEITENIREKFFSSAELKKFISSHMKNSYFYSKDKITLIRK